MLGKWFGTLFNAASQEKNVMKATIKKVDTATLAQWIAEGTAVVVDVREPVERLGGIIPGSINHPLSRFNPQQIKVDSGQHLVFHCQKGFRCEQASEMTALAGFAGNIYRLDGGFASWVGAGGNVVQES